MATFLYRTKEDGSVEKGKFPAHRVQNLLKSGWRATLEAEETVEVIKPIAEMDKEELQRELKELEVSFHPNTGEEKLREALEAARAAATADLAKTNGSNNPWQK